MYFSRVHCFCWSQWPRGLRCRSAAARLLRMWVPNPPGTRMFFCCVCCQEEVSATSRSLVQRSPTDCSASLCGFGHLVNDEALAYWGAVAPKHFVSALLPVRPSHYQTCLSARGNCVPFHTFGYQVDAG